MVSMDLCLAVTITEDMSQEEFHAVHGYAGARTEDFSSLLQSELDQFMAWRSQNRLTSPLSAVINSVIIKSDKYRKMIDGE